MTGPTISVEDARKSALAVLDTLWVTLNPAIYKRFEARIVALRTKIADETKDLHGPEIQEESVALQTALHEAINTFRAVPPSQNGT